MKKVLMILLALAMVFTMAGVVSAGEVAGESGDSSNVEVSHTIPDNCVVSMPVTIPLSVADNYDQITSEVTLTVTKLQVTTGKSLYVTMKSSNGFEVTDSDESSIPYSAGLKGDDGTYADCKNEQVVLTASATGTSASMKFFATQENITAAENGGKHSDTLTFTYEFGDGAKAAFVASDEELDAAIENGAGTLFLGDGNYIIPDSAQGKRLTITGNGNTKIATQDDGSYEGCDYSLDGATATFKNIVIETDSTTYTGYARLSATYENCVINGTYTLYGDSTFIDCTFNVDGDVYNIWTWGAPTATFDGCTFNSDGKALLLYGTANTKLTVKNCVFNDNGGLTDLKAAIEIGNDYGKSYELIVANTVVNGYEINDKGINTGTTLWGNKNSMGQDRLNVVVDGVDVY